MKTPFLVKSAGGAASQLQALKTAIYVSGRIHRPFRFRHYPFSTGGHFPIAIKALLREEEIEDLEHGTRGLKGGEDTKPGMIIENHPLLRRGLNFEKSLKVIRHLGIDAILRSYRGELSLGYDRQKMTNVSKHIRSITGGYFPFIHEETDQELSSRFDQSGIPNPYKGTEKINLVPRIVIHYRIGEKRTTYSHPGLLGDGILDPISVKKILEGIPKSEKNGAEILVVSDEPRVAVKLLRSVGIEAKTPTKSGNLWLDMQIMGSATILVCPWSTVSQFMAALLIRSGKRVYYPFSTSRGFNPNWELPGLNKYEAIFLEDGHPIYNPDFILESDAHQIYQDPDKR
jgi:hypothetical protein